MFCCLQLAGSLNSSSSSLSLFLFESSTQWSEALLSTFFYIALLSRDGGEKSTEDEHNFFFRASSEVSKGSL